MNTTWFRNFDPQTAKWQMFGHNVLQILLSAVIVVSAAVICLAAVVMSQTEWFRHVSGLVAEIAALLIVGLTGLIQKNDNPIHTLGAELQLHGDWHENMRSLFRIKWLNTVQDIIGLIPGVGVFIVSQWVIVNYWEFPIPSWWVTNFNSLMLAAGVLLIPLTCARARHEVAVQAEEFKKRIGKIPNFTIESDG